MTKETPLVTDEELRKICIELEDDMSSDIFIQNAHTIVYDTYSGCSILSPERLKLVELYLAAHFVVVTNPATAFEGAGKVQESVQYKLGLGLLNTRYGQQADIISGHTLLSPRARVTWLGTIPRSRK